MSKKRGLFFASLVSAWHFRFVLQHIISSEEWYLRLPATLRRQECSPLPLHIIIIIIDVLVRFIIHFGYVRDTSSLSCLSLSSFLEGVCRFSPFLAALYSSCWPFVALFWPKAYKWSDRIQTMVENAIGMWQVWSSVGWKIISKNSVRCVFARFACASDVRKIILCISIYGCSTLGHEQLNFVFELTISYISHGLMFE